MFQRMFQYAERIPQLALVASVHVRWTVFPPAHLLPKFFCELFVGHGAFKLILYMSTEEDRGDSCHVCRVSSSFSFVCHSIGEQGPRFLLHV